MAQMNVALPVHRRSAVRGLLALALVGLLASACGSPTPTPGRECTLLLNNPVPDGGYHTFPDDTFRLCVDGQWVDREAVVAGAPCVYFPAGAEGTQTVEDGESVDGDLVQDAEPGVTYRCNSGQLTEDSGSGWLGVGLGLYLGAWAFLLLIAAGVSMAATRTWDYRVWGPPVAVVAITILAASLAAAFIGLVIPLPPTEWRGGFAVVIGVVAAIWWFRTHPPRREGAAAAPAGGDASYPRDSRTPRARAIACRWTHHGGRVRDQESGNPRQVVGPGRQPLAIRATDGHAATERRSFAAGAFH